MIAYSGLVTLKVRVKLKVTLKGIVFGMYLDWLIIDPLHRGNPELSQALLFRTLSYFPRENYDEIIAYTDEFRYGTNYRHTLH